MGYKDESWMTGALLRVWAQNQQCQHHLGTCQECRFLGPDRLNHKPGGWAPESRPQQALLVICMNTHLRPAGAVHDLVCDQPVGTPLPPWQSA